jgi:hypothetical protein
VLYETSINPLCLRQKVSRRRDMSEAASFCHFICDLLQ